MDINHYNELLIKIKSNDISTINFTPEIINFIPEKGDFAGISLIMHLMQTEEGRALLTDDNYALGSQISAQCLNAVVTEGESKGHSVAFWLAAFQEGRALLAHNNYALCCQISAQCLNALIAEGDRKGQSVAFWLAEYQKYPGLLAHNNYALGSKISAQCLNAVIAEGNNQGHSVAFWLAEYQEGRELLAHNNYALGSQISAQCLNAVVAEGDRKGQSVAFWLTEHKDEEFKNFYVSPLIQSPGLLTHNKYALGSKISAQCLNAVIAEGNNQGHSVAFWLATYQEGRALLTNNNYALGSQISAQCLNSLIVRGFYKGESVALRLAATTRGLALLAHHNYALGLQISAQCLNAMNDKRFSVAFRLAKPGIGRALLTRDNYALGLQISEQCLNANTVLPHGAYKVRSVASLISKTEKMQRLHKMLKEKHASMKDDPILIDFDDPTLIDFLKYLPDEDGVKDTEPSLGESYQLLEMDNYTSLSPLKAGVADKYLGGKLPELPREIIFSSDEEENTGDTRFEHDQEYLLATLVNNNIVNKQKSRNDIIHAGAAFSYHTNYAELPDKNSQTVFVFAGRKEAALLPKPTSTTRVILVATKDEYEAYKLNVPDDIDVLVTNNLLSPSHGNYDQVLGKINTRRLAVLLFCDYLELNHCLCLDDNISKIVLKSDKVPKQGTEYNLGDLYSFFNDSMSADATAPIILGLATISNYTKKDFANVFCAKVLFWNLQAVFANLRGDKLAYFAYPAQHSSLWGEDYVQQLMLRNLFCDDLRTPFKTIEPEAIGYHRSKNNVNSCVKSLCSIDDILSIDIKHSISNPDPELIDCAATTFDNLKAIVKDNKDRYQKQITERTNTDLLKKHAEANGVQWIDAIPAVYKNNNFSKDWIASLKKSCAQMQRLLKPHQMQALESIAAQGEALAHIQMATGSGKSRLQIALALQALQVNGIKPVIIVTATRNLVEQLYQDFIKILPEFNQVLDNKVLPQQIIKVMSGDNNVSVDFLSINKPIEKQSFVMIICIDSYLKLLNFEGDHFKRASLVMLDEYHLYHKNKVLEKIKKIAMTKLSVLYGLTATPPVSGFSKLLYAYSLEQAISDKVIAPFKVMKLNINYDKANVEQQILNFVNFLNTTDHPNGGKLIAHKTVVYLPSIENIKELSKILTESQIDHCQIHTMNPNSDKDLDIFKAKPSGCVALACGQLRVGYSDNTLDTAIYLRSGSNDVDVKQVAGRVMRVNPADNNKVGFIITLKDAITTEFDKYLVKNVVAKPVLTAFNTHISQTYITVGSGSPGGQESEQQNKRLKLG